MGKWRGNMPMVWLDAGHGMGNRKAGVMDPGATWFGRLLEYGKRAVTRWWWEHNMAKGYVNRVAAKLRAAGVGVFITNSGKYTERAGKAWAAGCDFGVSHHFNAPASGTGSESFVHPHAGSFSKELQRQLHKRVVPATGVKDRGMKQYGYAVLAGKIPAVLWEIVFVGKDLQKFQTNLESIVDAEVAAILAVCGITAKLRPAPPQAAVEYVEFTMHARLEDVPALTVVAKEMGKAAEYRKAPKDSPTGWTGKRVN